MKRFLVIFSLLLSSLAALAQGNAPAQAGIVRPGDNLVLENVPAVPASIAEKAFQYGEVRTAGLEDWDPVRREMLIGTRFADVPQVHLVKIPGGAR
ncbi:MAG TPA: S9 family peptidase, partial [Candidatus Angelobacter sp.]|nr:S9 family peptidase [Candidatus Angelobacter sp.]